MEMRESVVSTVFSVLSKIKAKGHPFPIISLEAIKDHGWTEPIESDEVLAAYAGLISDWLNGAVEKVRGPYGKATAYKVGSAGDFVRQARELLVNKGLASETDFKDDSLSNIGSNERLRLVFDTNIAQAQQLATWQTRVEDEAYLNQFPAARFVRMPGATIKRERHAQAEGEVRRWDDFEFWLYQNSPEIGGFGVPWGPFGFNSYMYQVPVKRKEAERLGLVRPGEIIRPISGARWGATLPEKLVKPAQVNTKKLSKDLSDKLRAELRAKLGNAIIDKDGKISLDVFRR